jgi:hypothetical protein
MLPGFKIYQALIKIDFKKSRFKRSSIFKKADILSDVP